MIELNSLITHNNACELDPRYQNLLEAFRKVAKRENIEQVKTYLQVLLISRMLLAEEQALFDGYNLSEGKLSVLLLLKSAEQNQLTPSEIAESTKVSRGTMTGLLAGLERDGYVMRQDDPGDGRRCTVKLVKSSEEIIDQLLLERFNHIDKLFSCFNQTELDGQRAIIEKLNNQLARDNLVEEGSG